LVNELERLDAQGQRTRQGKDHTVGLVKVEAGGAAVDFLDQICTDARDKGGKPVCVSCAHLADRCAEAGVPESPIVTISDVFKHIAGVADTLEPHNPQAIMESMEHQCAEGASPFAAADPGQVELPANDQSTVDAACSHVRRAIQQVFSKFQLSGG
jgi:hypothetical protein